MTVNASLRKHTWNKKALKIYKHQIIQHVLISICMLLCYNLHYHHLIAIKAPIFHKLNKSSRLNHSSKIIFPKKLFLKDDIFVFALLFSHVVSSVSLRSIYLCRHVFMAVQNKLSQSHHIKSWKQQTCSWQTHVWNFFSSMFVLYGTFYPFPISMFKQFYNGILLFLFFGSSTNYSWWW